MFDAVTPPTIIASLLLTLATVTTVQRWRLGPTADWIEAARATTLPPLDPAIERTVGGIGSAYETPDREVVGVIDADSERVERRLFRAGCRRNVLSAHKSLADGREQIGAWVYRGSEVDPKMQVDVLLFEAADGGTTVAAHHEFSSDVRWLWRDPSVLRDHYRTRAYDPEAGARLVRRTILTDAEWA
ncbi:MAG: hypothetical protein ABEI80_09605 [Haloplanus sp.]